MYASWKRLILIVLFCCAFLCSAAQAEGTLTIPAGTKQIDAQAFYNDVSIRSIILPEGVLEISSEAFAKCGALQVTLPASLTYIAPNAFDQTPDALVFTVTAGSYAEQWCIAQNKSFLAAAPVSDFTYTIENSEATITGYTGTAENLVIPSAVDGCPVTSIGKAAFSANETLVSVVVPYGVRTLAEDSFTGISTLQSLSLPTSLQYIGVGAFSGCSQLSSVSIPEGVTELGLCAFMYCTGLEQLSLPDSLVTIGGYAFDDCWLLEEVTIPRNVATIGDRAFSMCRALSTINVDARNTHYSSVDGVLYTGDGKCVLICPTNKTGSYAIPVGTTEIGPYAFDSTVLEAITIPEGIVTIGNSAFLNSEKLSAIELPASVTSIGSAVFRGGEALTSITVRTGNTAFSSVDGVLFNKDKTRLLAFPAARTGSYTIPSGVTEICDNAFGGAYLMTEIILPAGVTHIGSYGFGWCSGLDSMVLPDGLLTIASNAFAWTSLSSINLPDSLTSIHAKAFYYSTKSLTCTVSENSVGHTWCIDNSVSFVLK